MKWKYTVSSWLIPIGITDHGTASIKVWNWNFTNMKHGYRHGLDIWYVDIDNKLRKYNVITDKWLYMITSASLVSYWYPTPTCVEHWNMPLMWSVGTEMSCLY
jgi:hypothetical protein